MTHKQHINEFKLMLTTDNYSEIVTKFFELPDETQHAALAYLIEWHENSRHLLTEFFQSASDACPLEAELAEKTENEFNDFVINKQSLL